MYVKRNSTHALERWKSGSKVNLKLSRQTTLKGKARDIINVKKTQGDRLSKNEIKNYLIPLWKMFT